MRTTGAWLRAASGLAGALAAGDAVAGGVPSAMVWALGLGLGAGLLFGGALTLAFAGLSRLPRRVGLAVWPVLGVAGGLWGAQSIGAFARLGGPHRAWALVAIVGGVGLGGLIGALVAGFQPGRGAPEGWIAARRARVRGVIAAGGGALFVGALIADRMVMVGLYPAAHTALRCVSYVGLVFALMSLAMARRALPYRGDRLLLVAALGLIAVPYVWLGAEDTAAMNTLVRRPYAAVALSVGRAVTDFDRDGHSSLLGGGDCAPFDGSVHPQAPEIPGNGVDDNCKLGDAEVLEERAEEVPEATTPSPVSVLLITVDTTRPDHMSVYGYERDTTPRLKEWARQARVFTRAYTPGCHTTAAVLPMMRGYYVRNFTVGGVEPDPMEHPPLAWWLQRRGMVTAAVVNDGNAGYLSRERGFAVGFDVFRRMADHMTSRSLFAVDNDAATTAMALRVMQSLPRTKPFFLWVHYFGPHAPSVNYPGHHSFGDDVIAKYDTEVLYWDAQVAALLAAARAQQDIVVIVAADHGEVLVEPRSHVSVDDAVIRIPFLMAGPGIEPGIDDRVVSLVDMLPTIGALTRTPVPRDLDGVDILSGREPRILLSDCENHLGENSLAAYDGTRKLVHDVHTNSYAATGGEPTDDLRAAILRYLELIQTKEAMLEQRN